MILILSSKSTLLIVYIKVMHKSQTTIILKLGEYMLVCYYFPISEFVLIVLS